MKERLHYIDIAKGILILLMLINHTTFIYPELESYNKSVFSVVSYFGVYYGPFFMSAFFLISGYCSNFCKNLSSFVISNVKGIILPAFFFSVLQSIADSIFQGNITPIKFLLSLGYWMYPAGFWFFTALVEVRFVLWIFLKLCKRYNISNGFLLVITFILGFLGILINKIGEVQDYSILFVYQQAMMALPFITFGHVLKEKDISSRIKIGAYLYIASLLLFTVFDKPTPTYAFVMSMKVYHYPVFVFLAITGSALVIYVAQLISRNSILEFIGRNSIVFYGLNYIVLHFSSCLFCSVLGNSDSVSFTIFYLFFVYLFSVLLLSLLSFCLSCKQVRRIIGR